MAEQRQRESLTEETETAIEEARMVLPGMQALFGFQLIAVFNERFDRLSETLRLLHLASLILVALAVAFVMAPAAFHRISERGWVSRQLIDLTSNFITIGMLALSVALAIEIGLVSVLILGNAIFASILGGGIAVALAFCWFILPLRRRHRMRSSS